MARLEPCCSDFGVLATTGEPGSVCLPFALALPFYLPGCQLAPGCPPLPATLAVSLALPMAQGTRTQRHCSGRGCIQPRHFTEAETESQRGAVTRPKSQEKLVAEPTQDPLPVSGFFLLVWLLPPTRLSSPVILHAASHSRPGSHPLLPRSQL